MDETALTKNVVHRFSSTSIKSLATASAYQRYALREKTGGTLCFG